MKYSIVVKFLAILLASCSLICAIGGTVGIVALESSGLYVNGLEMLQDKEFHSIASTVASDYVNYYAAKKLSNLSYAMRESRYANPEKRGDAEHWTVSIKQGDTVLIDPGNTSAFPIVKQFSFVPVYPIVSLYGPNDTIPENITDSGTTSSAYANIIAPEGYLYHEANTSWQGGSFLTYHFYYYEAPEYTATVYMRSEVLDSSALHILVNIYPHRYTFIVILALGMLLFFASMVYLIWAAGHRTDGTFCPSGLNRLPLDIYAILACSGITGLMILLNNLVSWVQYEGPHPGNLSILALNLEGIILLGIGFVYALSSQVKIPGYWWEHSLLRKCACLLQRIFTSLWRAACRVAGLLPLMWMWFISWLLIGVALCLCAWLSISSPMIPLLAVAFVFICMVCYSTYAYGTILSGARKMASGKLGSSISTHFLFGHFREFANHLNALADVAIISAEKQMRSERMKTELITNVSHDIKTPLTSVINYIDLLQKPHTEEQAAQYLEVLDRQSHRLKKLVEDIVALSKASSGNMPVNLTALDATESLNQALGEFSDKLAAAQLEAVFQKPDEPVIMLADGNLTWRVFNNLLSNAVKYSLTATRVYISLVRLEDRVLISFKNISQEPLNLSADDLMERFVRGDISRNTEGSGLGLNIAKNLMEIQNGQLHLLIDGDLFKVTLIFPAADS